MNADGTHFYRVPPPTRCHACTQVAIQQELRKDDGSPMFAQPTALHHFAVRHDRD